MSLAIPLWEPLEKTPPRPWLEVLAAIRATAPPPFTPTPRPIIDANAAEASLDRPTKEHPLLSASYWCDVVVDSFRELQLQKIMRVRRCGYTEAKEIAEDPDPYEKEYLFYCLPALKNEGIAFRRH
jgi:hypothetical protein